MCWCADVILVTGHLGAVQVCRSHFLPYVWGFFWAGVSVKRYLKNPNPSVTVTNWFRKTALLTYMCMYVYIYIFVNVASFCVPTLLFNPRRATSEAGSWREAAVRALDAQWFRCRIWRLRQERRWCQHLGRVPARCHSCCAGSVSRECKKVKKWRGRTENAEKTALKIEERANAGINK